MLKSKYSRRLCHRIENSFNDVDEVLRRFVICSVIADLTNLSTYLFLVTIQDRSYDSTQRWDFIRSNLPATESNLDSISKVLMMLFLTRLVPLVSPSFCSFQSAYHRLGSTEADLLQISCYRVGSVTSTTHRCDSGVPQGSVLSPLLFGDVISRFGVKFHQYADNNKVCLAANR